MMYAKLALRNVKRSAKDYLIYVITLILSVGLFYGFMSIASPYYNESLPVKINLEILNKAMRRLIGDFSNFLCQYLYAPKKAERVCCPDNYWDGTKSSCIYLFHGNHDYGGNIHHFGNTAGNRIISNCWLYCCAVF